MSHDGAALASELKARLRHTCGRVCAIARPDEVLIYGSGPRRTTVFVSRLTLEPPAADDQPVVRCQCGALVAVSLADRIRAAVRLSDLLVWEGDRGLTVKPDRGLHKRLTFDLSSTTRPYRKRERQKGSRVRATAARWSPHEDEIMEQWSGSDQELATRLDRSVHAIHVRRAKQRAGPR